MGNVKIFRVHPAPGQFKHQIEVIPQDGAFGIAHLGSGQTGNFLFDLGFEFGRNRGLLKQLKIAFLLLLGTLLLA